MFLFSAARIKQFFFVDAWNKCATSLGQVVDEKKRERESEYFMRKHKNLMWTAPEGRKNKAEIKTDLDVELFSIAINH